LAPVIGARVNQWLGNAGDWASELLLREHHYPETPLVRQQLATGINELDMLVSQLAHDAGARGIRRSARALRARLLLLVPVLSSLSGRLHALHQGSDAPPRTLTALKSEIAEWIRLGYADDGAVVRFREALGAMALETHQPTPWDGMLYASLLT